MRQIKEEREDYEGGGGRKKERERRIEVKMEKSER
jgi:hypothetical protein